MSGVDVQVLQSGMAVETNSGGAEDVSWDNIEEVSVSDVETSSNDIDSDWDDIDETAPSMEAIEESDDSEVVEAQEEVKAEAEESSDSEEVEASEESKALDVNELDDNAIVKVKVDGELQEISVKEFKNGISGEKAIAKRFSEFDQKEKAFKSEIENINNYVRDLGETMRNSSMLEGVYKIAELNKIAPHQVKQALIKELLPEIDRLDTLTDSERELEYRQQELEYKEKLQESESESFKAQQAQRELQDKISSTREAHNISVEEWDNAYKELDENLPPEEQITIDTVSEYIQYGRAEGKAQTALKEFQEGAFSSDEGKLDELTKVLVKYPEFTTEDAVSLLQDAYGQAKEEVAKQEVTKAVSKKEIKQVKQKKQNDSEINPITINGEEADDWDDIL